MTREERLKSIEKMLESNSNDSFLNYAAALEYHKFGQMDKSIKLLEKLIKQDPKYLGSYYQLGKFYEEKNMMTKAIATYRKGLPVAKELNDHKTQGELSEALMFIDEKYDGTF